MKHAVAILSAALTALLASAAVAAGGPQPLKITDFELFDLGIVDADGDGTLDLFTTNHSAAQGIWLGDGQGGFRNVLSDWGLNQSAAFPGLEYERRGPRLVEPGFYIYRKGRTLRMRAHRAGRLGAVRGTLKLRVASAGAHSVSIRQARRSKALIGAVKGTDGEIYATVDFAVEPGGRLDLHTDVLALPHYFALEGIAAEEIFIGSRGVHPAKPRFSFEWKDRHGQAWSDFEADGVIDVLLSRGALLGEIDRFRGPAFVNSQLFITQTDGSSAGSRRFRDVAREVGLRQESCRAYKPTWVDFDRDLDLDLYIGCRESPNQLYRREDDGTLYEMAEEHKLGLAEGHAFEWFDVDGDTDADLLAEGGGALWLYVNRRGPSGGRWFERHPVGGRLKGGVRRLTTGDFDGDGDFDVFVSTTGRSVLLINESGRLTKQDAKALGLPERTVTASWVDADLDGRLDLYAVPGGLYRQGGDGRFEETGELKRNADRARVAWFDADNDGAWDLVVSTHTERRSWTEVGVSLLKFDWLTGGGEDPAEASTIWNTVLYQDLALQDGAKPARESHWLQVSLVGPPENREAIGTRVELTTSDGTQVHRVGDADGSHYSQGHYRVYFGLGPHQTAERLRVIWPEGEETVMEGVAADRLLTIRKGKAKAPSASSKKKND